MKPNLKTALELAKSGQGRKAAGMYDALLGASPKNAVVLTAAIHFHNRYSLNFRAAVPLVLRLLELKPKAAKSHAAACETFCNCQRLPQAVTHADQAVAGAPDDPDILFVAAAAYLAVDQFDRAISTLDHALQQRAGHRPSLNMKARALRNAGDMDAAREISLTLWKADRNDLNAITNYCDVTPLTPDDPVFTHLSDTLAPAMAKRGGADHRLVLQLLAKAKTDMGQHREAFQLIARSKTAAPMIYDAKGYADFVMRVCHNISTADFADVGAESDHPVLIVGMPRSGSTLVEQMLASHPDVASVGESPALNVIVQDTRVRTHHGGDMVAAIKQIPPEAQARLAQRYLDETAKDGALRVIDKSLHNFELLGFFAKLLPRARIIHVTRDPLDTCVSCYMQRLSSWHKYTQDQDSLGHAYRHYWQLMDHWAQVLPNPMMQIAYEDVVTDPHAASHRLADFVGVPWTDTMLAFQNADNRSATLSTWQVRQPLYKTAMRRWQRYGDLIDPLKKQLAAFYPDGFDV